MTDQGSFHENFGHGQEVKLGSGRAFGLVFAAVFSIVGLLPLWGGGAPRIWALGIAALFGALALIAPQLLAPLNRAWFAFGLALHKIVSPLVMGLLFFLTVTPTGLLMRAFGKTPLQLGFDKEAQTYWIKREPPGPEPDSMKRQF